MSLLIAAATALLARAYVLARALIGAPAGPRVTRDPAAVRAAAIVVFARLASRRASPAPPAPWRLGTG
jgi:hypothetical protein